MVTKRAELTQYPRYLHSDLQCDSDRDRRRRNYYRYYPLEPPEGFFATRICGDIGIPVHHKHRQHSKQLAGAGIPGFNGSTIVANRCGSAVDVAPVRTRYCGGPWTSCGGSCDKKKFLKAQFASESLDSRYLSRLSHRGRRHTDL